MLVVFMTKMKHKILKGLRFALVLTILTILLVQLAGVLKSAGFEINEKIPSGNPMRVNVPVSEACGDEVEHGFIEKLMEEWLKSKKDTK